MGKTLEQVALRLRELFDNLISILQRLLRLRPRPSAQPCEKRPSLSKRWRTRRTLDDFAVEIEREFTGHLTTKQLASMAAKIRTQIDKCAKTSPVCMLPSFNHTLPTGREKGTFLALDVGGSTFRVALVELSGENGAMKIVRMTSSVIDESVKLLEGRAFFDWIALKIGEMLEQGTEGFGQASTPLSMGLSWSFPIDQTSIRSGLVISMGKGFLCSNGTVGDDLSELIMAACHKRNLNVRIEAIVNDSSATLLSRAYSDPSTRMSLILGTGTNVAIHYPTSAIGLEKFGNRSAEWFAEASRVIVNTELSMFGGGVLAMTRWDDDLNRSHIKPDYQPLEYMITGRYLGEIVRLLIVEAVQVAGLFGGELPMSMRTPYSFDTAIVACIEGDSSPTLADSSAFLQKSHKFLIPPTTSDLQFLQKICKCVSKRGAAYLATAIYSLWCLSNESESPIPPSTPDSDGNEEELKQQTAVREAPSLQVTIACDGSVINKYPNFRSHCQTYLNSLTSCGANSGVISTKNDGAPTSLTPVISLDPAPESGILGAAVAVAVALPSK
ncbi:hexokinase-1 [Arthroderma uncinatum]|uniref:hexokinase-1 n=1 Tax=Arthroderma uncinatum TaxID=74035 RepID=UPI00144AEC39|nr:hexokinase-1 [Arthroderma uncinatum]KAF3484247.1 hexokinase-1 [Arthroderma uncinatum]